MNYDLKSKYALHSYLGEIAEDNYFNELHQIIRIKFDDKYYDFRYESKGIIPHPNLHLAMISATEETINSDFINLDRQKLLPGIIDKFGNIAALPYGKVELLNRKQLAMATNPQNGSAGFSIEDSTMSDLGKLRIAFTPPLNKDYTNVEGTPQSSQTRQDSNSQEDTGDQNIGIFINDDSVVLKSKGAQVTLGKEGIHFGGSVFYEASEHTREWMFDNTLSRFIPSTIPTAIISIPELPNIEKFAKYGQFCQRVISIANKGSKITNLLRNS
jgi:hypothetical protein